MKAKTVTTRCWAEASPSAPAPAVSPPAKSCDRFPQTGDCRRPNDVFVLGQHRTILRVESRRQIFWQVKQKAQRILCVFASIFVTVAGKSASEATLKASAVNCAVLPKTASAARSRISFGGAYAGAVYFTFEGLLQQQKQPGLFSGRINRCAAVTISIGAGANYEKSRAWEQK